MVAVISELDGQSRALASKIEVLIARVGARQSTMHDWRYRHTALTGIPIGELWKVADAGEQKKLLAELFEGIEANTRGMRFRVPGLPAFEVDGQHDDV